VRTAVQQFSIKVFFQREDALTDSRRCQILRVFDKNILKTYFIIIKEFSVMFLFVPMLALSLRCRPRDKSDEL